MSKDTLSFPNILTILRFLLSTLVFFFLLKKETLTALSLFVLVAVTDVADGFFARSMNKKSSFGEMLDPMADKFMVFLALTALFAGYGFPIYGILIIARDIVSLLGSLILFLTSKKNWQPNNLGKLTTFLQILTIIAFIINFPIKYYLLNFAIFISILSAGVYFVRGTVLFRHIGGSTNV